jgi:hypothetical protein
MPWGGNTESFASGVALLKDSQLSGSQAVLKDGLHAHPAVVSRMIRSGCSLTACFLFVAPVLSPLRHVSQPSGRVRVATVDILFDALVVDVGSRLRHHQGFCHEGSGRCRGCRPEGQPADRSGRGYGEERPGHA